MDKDIPEGKPIKICFRIITSFTLMSLLRHSSRMIDFIVTIRSLSLFTLLIMLIRKANNRRRNDSRAVTIFSLNN